MSVMAEQTQIEIIKKLLKSGFDIELISFELDIPIDLVRQCKTELESTNKNSAEKANSVEKINSAEKTNSIGKKTYTAQEVIDIKNNQARSKIDQMRERYNELYSGSNSNSVKVAKQPKEHLPKEHTPLSQEELEFIKTVIETIRTNIQEMESLPKKGRGKDKRGMAINILAELKKIDKYQLPIEQAEELYNLMCSEQLKRLNQNSSDGMNYWMRDRRKKCALELAKAINIEQDSVEDLEELQKLAGKITYGLVNESPISIGTVQTTISSRIKAIRHQQAIDRIRNNIPARIASIITDLASGTIDMQKANRIIDVEAKRRVQSKPKTRFSLTEEQERGQILIQIRTELTEKTDQYHIQNPEKAVLQIQELCGTSVGLAVSAVVKNLIGRKDFKTAKIICDKFSSADKEERQKGEQARYFRTLRDEIRNAEISDIVMKAINTRGTSEEARAYYDLIEQGLNMGNVKMSAVSLGKNKDGTKNITLADVWIDEPEKVKLR